MAVRIRLSRTGKKHVPFYRVIAVDSRSKRDGQFLANIGTYDALKGSIVRFDEDLYKEWVGKGALPSDSAKKIYRQHKRDQKTDTVVVAPKASKAPEAKKAAKAGSDAVKTKTSEKKEATEAKK